MNAERLQFLFGKTLKGDYDDDQPWDAVRELQLSGDREVLAIAVTWCQSSDPLMRARALDVIAQLGKAENRSNSFPEEAFSVVSELTETEIEIQPLSSGIFALGHLDDIRGIPITQSIRIMRIQRSDTLSRVLWDRIRTMRIRSPFC